MTPTSKPLVNLIDTIDGNENRTQDPTSLAANSTHTPSGRARGKSDSHTPPRLQSKSTIHTEARASTITRADSTTSPPVANGQSADSPFKMPTSQPSLRKRSEQTVSTEPISPRGEERRRSASISSRPASPEKSLKPNISRLNLSSAANYDELSPPSSPSSRVTHSISHVSFSDGLNNNTNTNNNSSSAPTTPRSSYRRNNEEWSPRRSSVSTSPRKVFPLAEVSNEAARLIVQSMKAQLKEIKPGNISHLARLDTKLPIASFSDGLKVWAGKEISKSISHSRLIKILFLDCLADSAIGKTIRAMRTVVMSQYDGDSLTTEKAELTEEESIGFKKRMKQNIESEAQACAKVLMGVDATSLSASKLPQEIVDFWKALDRELHLSLSTISSLSTEQVLQARSNLGFDLVVTRLVMPLVSGPKTEANLAVPQMLVGAVTQEIKKKWPAFFESFVKAVAAEEALEKLPTTTIVGALPRRDPAAASSSSSSSVSPIPNPSEKRQDTDD